MNVKIYVIIKRICDEISVIAIFISFHVIGFNDPIVLLVSSKNTNKTMC